MPEPHNAPRSERSSGSVAKRAEGLRSRRQRSGTELSGTSPKRGDARVADCLLTGKGEIGTPFPERANATVFGLHVREAFRGSLPFPALVERVAGPRAGGLRAGSMRRVQFQFRRSAFSQWLAWQMHFARL